MRRADDEWRSPLARELPARTDPLPAPPRTDVRAVTAYATDHLPRLLAGFRSEAGRLSRFDSPVPGAPRRTLDVTAEVLRRSDDETLHDLAAAVRRGTADERDLRRHPEFGRVLREIAAERAAAYDALAQDARRPRK